MGAPDSIYRLVEKFERHKPGSETEVRVQFVDELFRALGWDMRDKRQVRHEPRVIIKEAGLERSKRPDYSFHTGNPADFYVETKMPHVNLERNPIPAFQLRRYGWSGNAPVSVLTDFEEFSVYDCRIQPQRSDPAKKARLRYYRYGEYIDRWDELEARFSREAVARGALREWVEGERVRGLFSVDQAFLREMETWREALAQEIALHNRELSRRQLNLLVQRTIDRIVFLRIAEDRDIEAYGRLRSAAASGKQVYDELKILFNEADDKYNSGLFHFGNEARASQPDTLSLRIHIPDAPLRRIISSLYFPTSPYEFSALSADILGQVYEQFLGKVIEISGGVRVEEKPEVRKAGGVYYTPAYIVDYIVENTVGELLRGKSPKEAAKLRILDPACGSGSFLTGAYQYLLDWHLKIYSAQPRRYRNVIREVRGRYVLTTVEKRRILENSIYGVDLDQNAVEVSKLSLLLKMLENEDGSDATGLQTVMFSAGERILPDLSGNIKWGNSLIGSDFYSGEQMTLFDDEALLKVKPFDWEGAEGFGEIMAAGGFDAVIGNPPWGSKEVLDSEFLPYISNKYGRDTHNMNIFAVFVDECTENLLRKDGVLGFLIPKNFTKTESYQPYRENILNNHSLNLVVDFGQFPGVAQEAVAIFVSAKTEGSTRIQRIYVDNGEFIQLDNLNVEDVRDAQFSMITLARMPNLSPVVRKVDAVSFNLGDEFEVGRGLEHGRNGDLIRCPNCLNCFERPGKRNKNLREIKCKSCRTSIDISTSEHDMKFIYHSKDEINLETQSLLVGASIDRYRLKEIPYSVVLGLPSINYKGLQQMNEKLYFIRIAKSLRGYLDKEGLLALNALNFVHKSKSSVPYRLEYILGVLNSRLLKSYVEFTVTGGANLTIRLSNAIMRSLPIRTIDFDNPVDVQMHDEMVKLVDEMLSRHEQLPRLTGEGRRITEALIRTVDEKIDALVYRLYGLSDEEIAIVEGG